MDTIWDIQFHSQDKDVLLFEHFSHEKVQCSVAEYYPNLFHIGMSKSPP